MEKFKFEYRITFAYLIIGSLWILFSDRILSSVIEDIHVYSEIQTFKGWFYVLVTGLLFFLFLKSHLRRLRVAEKELENHRDNLEQLVLEKTKDLDLVIANLSDKNKVIVDQNLALNKAMEDLKNTQDQLMQAEKMSSLGILTAGIAHEVNNPLNYISGGLTGLESFFDENKIDDKSTMFFLNSIKTGVERVSTIVSGLNKLSRNKETYAEDCDIHEIIDNCLVIIHSQLENRIEINKSYANAKVIVLGNVGQLHQVFLNILLNAIQSIEKEGTISIRTKIQKGRIGVEIADTGCGIQQKDLSKVTDPFYTTKDPGKGTGLGLSISYTIVIQHKGHIEFISQPNEGTTVKIELPAKESAYE